MGFQKYLGSKFRADGDQKTDIRARIAVAMSTFGKMRNIWASRTTPVKLKIRIYSTGVCSRLTYGSEAWKLDEVVIKMLNGANSRMMARITGTSVVHEQAGVSKSFDIIAKLRARRLQRVGHILRMDPSRMVHQALKHIHETRPIPAARRHNINTRGYVTNPISVTPSALNGGDLLMDVPHKLSWSELKQMATDRDSWRPRVKAITLGQQVEIKIATHLKTTRARPSIKTKRPSAPASTKTEYEKTAQRYRTRDAHEAFFRPGRQRKTKNKSKQAKKSKKPFVKLTPGSRPLTTKERQNAAREHWDLHHGLHKDVVDTLTKSNPFAPARSPNPPIKTVSLIWETASGEKIEKIKRTTTENTKTPPQSRPISRVPT